MSHKPEDFRVPPYSMGVEAVMHTAFFAAAHCPYAHGSVAAAIYNEGVEDTLERRGMDGEKANARVLKRYERKVREAKNALAQAKADVSEFHRIQDIEWGKATRS